MKQFKTLGILLISTLIYSCTDKEDSSVKPGISINPNQEELITTVEIQLSDSNHIPLDTVSFNDPDGDGGIPPSIDTLKLGKGQKYFVKLNFLDKSNPADIKDITAEIKAEGDEHLICFDPMNISGLNIIRTDSDGTYELGIESSWTVDANANSNNGKLRLSLKHQPGVKDGTCAPGTTDVEIDFPVTIN